MGNVRNPVGPLPSSIYWRRRAVVLCLLAIAAALVVWLVLPGAGGGSHGHDASGPGHGRTPLPSITPGPTSSRPGITTAPGGRTSGGSGDADGGGSGSPSSGASSSAGSGAGGASGGSGGDGSGGSAGPGGDGGSGGSGEGSSTGTRLPVSTSVPDCAQSHAHLQVRSVHSHYAAGRQPQFAITAVNSGTSACKVNFSAVGTVVTVSDSTGHHVWGSDDCPPGRTPYLLRVPAGGTTIDDVTWNRSITGPQCTRPAGGSPAGAGDYHLRVVIPGLAPATTTFTLG